jgi:hypothetical protein
MILTSFYAQLNFAQTLLIYFLSRSFFVIENWINFFFWDCKRLFGRIIFACRRLTIM